MRARLPVLISFCASVLAISAACSDSANPITGPDGPVAFDPATSVVITPSQATLSAGSQVAMKVTSSDSSGKPVTGSVTWSSSDTTVAKVSSSGNVIAIAPGQATITAHVGDIRAAASVEVSNASVSGPNSPGGPTTSGPTPSSPPAGNGASGLWTDEPSGLGDLTSQPWNSITGLGWQMYDTHHHLQLVSDPSVPTGDPQVLEFHYPKGYSGGGYGPGMATYNFSSGEMYLGFYWKMSPNWQGHTSGINKILYIFQRNGNDRQAVVLEAYGRPGGPYRVRMANEPNNDQWIDQNVDNVELEPGKWHKIELHMRRSSSDGAPDGLIEWWVDGQLAARYTDAKLRDEPFSEVHIDPVWGGVDASISKQHDDYFRYGRIRVSGK